jgi:hypothetical protein
LTCVWAGDILFRGNKINSSKIASFFGVRDALSSEGKNRTLQLANF